MRLRNILWWLAYCFAAIWLQRLVPGLDACAPGLLLSLQEGNRKQTALLLLLFILIQEGSGTMVFGSSLLWYGSLILLFYVGCWFFLAESLLFILFLSAALGAMRWVIGISMSALAGVPDPGQRLIDESLVQAGLTFIIWGLAYILRGPRSKAAVQ